ncbi:hypothetical protein [Salinifilum ghardaiensis]
MGSVRDLVEQEPGTGQASPRTPRPEGWRRARPGETERQRVDRVSRSCWHCGREFPAAGAELDAHEDQH